MSGPPPTARALLMVEAYAAGGSFLQVAKQFGVTPQCVHTHVRRHAPKSIRPRGQTKLASVGALGQELFKQGKCRVCEVSLWGYRPTARTLCGYHTPAGAAS